MLHSKFSVVNSFVEWKGNYNTSKLVLQVIQEGYMINNLT